MNANGPEFEVEFSGTRSSGKFRLAVHPSRFHCGKQGLGMNGTMGRGRQEPALRAPVEWLDYNLDWLADSFVEPG